MITKKCWSCGYEFPLDDLKKDNRYPTGREAECKKCHNERGRIYAKNNRAKEWNRLKNWREKNKKHCYEQSLSYRQTPQGKLKRNANNKVYYAIKTGKLSKQNCEICGKTAHAHHEDYSKPLQVNWLCRTHHAERHQK